MDMQNEKLIERDKKLKDFIEKYQATISNFDTTLKQKILISKAFEIHRDICQTKLFSATIVVLIFCFKSIEANNKTNCLTEIMFDQAISRAKFLDDFLAKWDRPFGPLHGVPFSIKDTFDVEGFGKIYSKSTHLINIFFRFYNWTY